MSISAVGAPVAILDQAAGQYKEITVRYTSTVSMSGKFVRINPALWLINQTVEPAHLGAFYYIYSFTPGTYPMIWAGNDSQLNINATVTVIDNQNFEVTLRFIHFADLDTFIDGSGNAPIDRVLLQTLGASSVYNQQKKFYFYLYCQLAPNNVVKLYTPIEYTAGHYNRSSNNGNPLANWTYVLTQNGQNASGFSQLIDTKINFFIPSSTPIQNKFYFGIFKASNPASGGTYWSALNMQYAEVQSGTKNTLPIPIPNNKIVAQSGLAMVFNSGLASVTIDSSYFEANESYQFFLAVQIGQKWQSWISPEIGVSETADPTYGDIIVTGEIEGLSTVFGNCIGNVTPGMSLTFCATHDKPSYNAALLANNLGVSFDANLRGYNVIKTNQIPFPNTIPTGQALSYIANETSTTSTICTELTISNSDIGEDVYLAFIWEFEVNTGSGTYTDQIITYAKYNVVAAVPSPDITLGDIVINEEVFTGSVICDGSTDEILVNIDIQGGICEGAEYDVTLHHKEDAGIDYSECITDVQETPEGLAVTIDATCLPQGEYCITVNLYGCGESQSEPICDECIEYSLEFDVLQLGEESHTLQVSWDFSNFTGFESARGLIITSAPARQQFEFDVNSQIGSFSWGEDGSGNPRNIDPQVLFIIENNGCTYYVCWFLNYYISEVGFFGNIIDTICPNVNYCNDFVLYPTPCEDEAGNLTLECTEPGTVAISAETGWDIEYNLDGGNTWIPYTGPITIDPETNETCSVYARAILPATEQCPETIEYAIIDDCCPEIDCPELLCEPIVNYDEEAETLELGYDCGSEEIPDNVTIEYSVDGGVNWLTYTTPIDVSALDSVLYRIVIDYSETYPLCDPNEFIFEEEWFKDGGDPGLCESVPALEAQYINGCHIAIPTGDTFFVDTDIISYSIDNGVTFNEWDNQPVCGVDMVIWKREVCYTNNCPCDCIIALSKKATDINCDCIEWTVSINRTNGTLCPVVFGLDDYNVNWHIGSNNGFVPLGSGGGFNSTNFTVLGGVNTLDIGVLAGFNNMVYVNGLLQVSPANYTITGSVITFVDPPLEDYTVTIVSLQNEAGCIPITSNGLYRVTITDSNGCTRYAYRLEYVCDECPNCEISIEKISEVGLGIYEAVLDCPEPLSGVWQRYNTITNEWVGYTEDNPMEPDQNGLYRFIGIVDNNSDCPVEASVIVCEFSESQSQPGCVGPNYRYSAIAGQGDWEISEIAFEGFTLDNATPGMNFPYQIYPGGYGLEQLDKDLNTLMFNDNIYQCCDGIDTPVKVDITYDGITNNYSLNINCIAEQYWGSGWKPVSLTTSDGPYNFTETEDSPECCNTDCINYQYTAIVETNTGDLEELSLVGDINLSLEAGFNFPYDLTDSAARTQLQTDLETWIADNLYRSCCPDPTMELNSAVDIEYGYEPSIGTNLCRISIICWSEDNPEWLSFDTTNSGGNWMRVRLPNDFCCGFA